jgi:chromosome segregation ATPase
MADGKPETEWNFGTFEKYINQRFGDLSLQLRERYEAQQTGVTAALAAAEKAVNAALIAAEKAVDKAEGAQQLRNEAQNEFRKSLSDLSGLMWTIKEGTEKVESLRRELTVTIEGLQRRTGILETGNANIQGRIWGVSALFAIGALALDVGVRFLGH